MKKVIIESPFMGNDEHSEAEHRKYLNRCIHDTVLRGESPYASHKMLVDSLDDSKPDERELGIQAGFEWKHLDGVTTVFYDDYGWSSGMKYALRYMEEHGITEYAIRKIGKNDA